MMAQLFVVVGQDPPTYYEVSKLCGPERTPQTVCVQEKGRVRKEGKAGSENTGARHTG